MTQALQKQLGDDWLLAYAAGSLSFGHEMVVAAHLELNDRAKNAYRSIEAAGGALLEDLEETPLDEGVLRGLMSSLGSQESAPGKTEKSNQPGFLPKSVARYFEDRDIEVKWKALGPGMKRFPILKGETGEKVWLLKAKPGTPIPEHGHRGSELTLVLTGKLIDGETAFIRGDIEEADESIEHQPTVGEGEDCICLVVSDRPLKFKGVFARALQPFIGL